MATNADTTEDIVVDDDTEVTEEDLRELKYGSDEVETPSGEDESTDDTTDTDDSEETGEEDGQTDDQAETSEEETPTEFVKQFPHIKGDTPDEYAKNLEAAYNSSTTEAMRLKGLVDQAASTDETATAETDIGNITSPTELYVKQQMDKEITEAYAAFSKKYPQVTDATEYSKFTNEVSILSNTIMNSQRRIASPAELYQKAAVILGWDPADAPDKSEKIAAAAKNGAAVSRTSSATKSTSKSKVTDAMISLNRKMYPGLSDDAIRKELEPYVQ